MGTTLRVMEIFDSVQGEGYWAGYPMTFVRLAGCNARALGLRCVAWCDTAESWDAEAGKPVEVGDIIAAAGLPRLCLTGGEPLLQPEGVAVLLAEAGSRGLQVHLETNGTLSPLEPCLFDFSWVVVSPKPPGYLIAPGWEGRVDELKLVADETLDAATAERVAAAYPRALVCIQPEYAGGRASADRALALVMSHPQWRLSIQIQKFLGIR